MLGTISEDNSFAFWGVVLGKLFVAAVFALAHCCKYATWLVGSYDDICRHWEQQVIKTFKANVQKVIKTILVGLLTSIIGIIAMILAIMTCPVWIPLYFCYTIGDIVLSRKSLKEKLPDLEEWINP